MNNDAYSIGIDEFLLDIADAIREIDGTTEEIEAIDFADRIRDGGGLNFDELLVKNAITRTTLMSLEDMWLYWKDGSSGTTNTPNSQYISSINQSEPSTYNYQSKITFKKACVLDINMLQTQYGTSIFYYNNVQTTPTHEFSVRSGDTITLRTNYNDFLAFVIFIKGE